MPMIAGRLAKNSNELKSYQLPSMLSDRATSTTEAVNTIAIKIYPTHQ